MSGTGHFDFGENLRPINFDNWLNDANYPDAMTLGFWLEYWIATYGHVLANHAKAANLLSFEELVSQPERTLERIEQTLKLITPQARTRQASDLRAMTEHRIPLAYLINCFRKLKVSTGAYSKPLVANEDHRVFWAARRSPPPRLFSISPGSATRWNQPRLTC